MRKVENEEEVKKLNKTAKLRTSMKFEEVYEIEPMLPKTSLRKSLTTFRFSSILADLGPVASEIGLRDRCLPLHKPGPVHGRCLLLPAGCLSGGCRPG